MFPDEINLFLERAALGVLPLSSPLMRNSSAISYLKATWSFMMAFLRQSLVQPTLVSNSRSCCFSLLSAKRTGSHHNGWL